MWVRATQDVEFVCYEGPVSIKAGEVVEVSDRVGSHIVELFGGVKVSPPVGEEAGDDSTTASDVELAVRAVVDNGDPDDFTRKGVPKLEAVRRYMPDGAEVTAEEVRAAFDSLTADDDRR